MQAKHKCMWNKNQIKTKKKNKVSEEWLTSGLYKMNELGLSYTR